MSGQKTAQTPPDAVWRACFGLPAGDEVFLKSCGPLDETLSVITAAAAETGLPLPKHAPREGCSLPDGIESDAVALKEILAAAAALARTDRMAAEGFADDGGFIVEPSDVRRIAVSISGAGRSRIVREACALKDGWELPDSAGLILINAPDQDLFRAEAEFLPGAQIYEAALGAADGRRHAASFPFERVIGPDPEGFSLRVWAAASRPAGSVFRRSAAAWLCSRVEEAIAALPSGRTARDETGAPSRWCYASAKLEALGASLARLSGPGPGHACLRLSLCGPFSDAGPFLIEFVPDGDDDGRTLADLAGSRS